MRIKGDTSIIIRQCLEKLELGTIEKEYQFAPPRLWRFDFAVPDLKLAVEIEGSGPRRLGRHQRPEGFESDCLRYSEATILGWVVFRFPTQVVLDGRAEAILGRWKAAQSAVSIGTGWAACKAKSEQRGERSS